MSNKEAVCLFAVRESRSSSMRLPSSLAPRERMTEQEEFGGVVDRRGCAGKGSPEEKTQGLWRPTGPSPEIKEPAVSSGYNSGDESHNNLCSPTSVLRCLSPSNEDSESQSPRAFPNFAEVQDIREDSSVSENFSEFSDYSSFETLIPNDIFDFRSSIPDFFEETRSLRDGGVLGDDFTDIVAAGSGFDFGFGGSKTWPADDYFQDIGDLFSSDPLVAL
ncbi:hypothetical protein FEM48_Zijuj11G0023200 [Ziziphus jujuba var. spinosa]|uniref:Uncharacterized protein n=1 Tax=Ziziphus jujuba var. spinosa TaxID=714518 RepID=A0A978UG94_ZIZJJ|nr:hypothetical protein FEM48_Zijuj11G0023200 [Ziziphus jujuba var. spinosa]